MEDLELRQILNLILDKVSSIETRLTAVEDRLTAVEDRLTTVEDSIAKLDARLTAVEDSITKLDARLTAVEDRLTAVETNVCALQADVTEIKLVQENVTNKHLQILSEGHQLLSDKFAQIDKASADIEELKGGMAVIEMTTAHNWSSISALKMVR